MSGAGGGVLPAPGPAAVTARPAASSVWWLSFVSFAGFVLANRIGSLGMAVCLGAWVLYIAAWPRRCLAWMEAYRLPWILPVYATLSALWSIEPAISLKLGIEFVLFTVIAIVAARAQNPRGLISSLMGALLIGMVLSAALRTTAAVGTTGEVALIGIFGSKNNLASFACLSMISSIPVLGDPRQPLLLRLLALAGLLLDPVILVKAHSLGALFAGGGAVAAAASIMVLGRLRREERSLLLSLTAILAIGVACVVVVALQEGFDLSSTLAAAGKDTSLTGRTFLWSRARDYIAMRPLLGLGYQSFWVQGHVEAEGLWRYAQIESRAGFHFHNLYYETAVELGALGVVMMAGSIVAAGVVAVRAGLTWPGPEAAFLCALMVFYAIRFFVELDFLDPFSPGSFLLPVIWVYGTRAWRPPAVRAGISARPSPPRRRPVAATP